MVSAFANCPSALCALTLICLSVPAFATELDFDYLAEQYEAQIQQYYAEPDFSIWDENTATIVAPAPKSEDDSLKVGSGSQSGAASHDDAAGQDSFSAELWF